MPTQISSDDIRIHGSTGSLSSGGSTGQDETDPKKFLGGRPSLFSEIPLNLSVSQIDLDNVFASVSGQESLTGSTKYRCIYIMNTHPTQKINDCLVWITKTTTAVDDEIFLGGSGIFNQSLESSSGRMVDFGGPVFSAPQIWLIFWGNAWSSTTTPSKVTIEQGVKDVINSGYYNALSQYRGLQPPIWGGSYIYTIPPPNNYDFGGIYTAILNALFETPTTQVPNPVTNPSVLPILIPHPKSRANTALTQELGGFHDWLYSAYDSKIPPNFKVPFAFAFPYTIASDPFFNFSNIIAHEICEVMTDPKFGPDPEVQSGLAGFTSAVPHTFDGEVSDVCVSTTVLKLGTGIVEPYWSNEDNACIINTTATGKTYFTEQVIPNENTAPDGVVFGQPFNVNPLNLGAIDPQHCVGFWFKRVVNAAADTTLNNRFTLHIQANI